MTRINLASALAMSLIATTAVLATPASAQSRVTVTDTEIRQIIRHTAQQAFTAGYKAGLKRNNNASTARVAYNRGYKDAINRVVSNSRGDLGNSYGYRGDRGYSYVRYEGAYRDSRPRYGNDAYARYDADDSPRYVYPETRNDYDVNPIGGLLNAVFAPLARPVNTAQNDRLAYCSSRYQSYNPNSGTYLANDGYRYSC